MRIFSMVLCKLPCQVIFVCYSQKWGSSQACGHIKILVQAQIGLEYPRKERLGFDLCVFISTWTKQEQGVEMRSPNKK